MTLLENHKKAIEDAMQFIDEGGFYLAGGTAVFYYLRHRESIDLDFFSQKEIEFLQFEKVFKHRQILFRNNHTIHAEVEQVKMSFFHYPYKLLQPLNKFEIVSMAHLEDILCMKINAIVNRGSRKDFTDVYFIMQELSLSADHIIEIFQIKYGAYNPLVINKAFTYFIDADNEPELKMLKRIKWEDIKVFFAEVFTKI